MKGVVLRCQVKLSKVVQIDIPEDVVGDQLPERLAAVTARAQYGYDFEAETLLVERSYRPPADKPSGCTCNAYQLENFGCRCGAEVE